MHALLPFACSSFSKDVLAALQLRLACILVTRYERTCILNFSALGTVVLMCLPTTSPLHYFMISDELLRVSC